MDRCRQTSSFDTWRLDFAGRSLLNRAVCPRLLPRREIGRVVRYLVMLEGSQTPFKNEHVFTRAAVFLRRGNERFLVFVPKVNAGRISKQLRS